MAAELFRCGGVNPAPRPKTEAGFTLVELVVVIVVIGLATGLLLPLFANWGQDALLASARRLSGTTRYLYNEAALTRSEHRLIFHFDDGSYEAKWINPEGELVDVEGSGHGGRLQGDAHFRDIVVTGRGKFNSGEVTVVFHPTGWIDETVLHLADEDDRQLTLRLAPLTGTVEVFEGYREF